ncbi:D-2-hydroxyacid dehydrogenase [Myxococcota bacterium]|nr:D-2-hydroxyacid dehydrogenase [Myxococcota bacterium]
MWPAPPPPDRPGVPRVVFLDRATVRATFRAPSLPHEWVEHAETAPSDVVARLTGATIAIVNKVRLTRDVIDALPALRMIAVAATGVDNVELDACRARGITVTNVRRYATTSVPEHALALILALQRNLFALASDVREGAWGRASTFCLLDRELFDLAGSTLGVIGWGALGQATGALGRALGMHVLVAERRGAAVREGRVAFEEVLERSDVVTLHAPLTPETRGLIGAAELARMKRSAILVNTARGGLVEERALVDALDRGQLRGAGFDVLESEPPRDGTPLLALAGRPNVIITPHVGWASAQSMQRLADRVVDNVDAWMRGAPLDAIV